MREPFQYYVKADGHTYEFTAPEVSILDGRPAKKFQVSRDAQDWYEFSVVLLEEEANKSADVFEEILEQGEIQFNESSFSLDEFLNIAAAVVVHEKLGIDDPILHRYDNLKARSGMIKPNPYTNIAGDVYTPSFENYLKKQDISSDGDSEGSRITIPDLYEGHRFK